VDLADIRVAHGLCSITSTEHNSAGIDLKLRFDERNSRIFDDGVGTFC
jgi:hypothetical protein